ncbi:hypothetical protein NUV26_24075 [Burkholderia pseudomultivorans]|uniref:hypothetical protein n=1 Tax=Burkholderia pseudomultivorans TaxID=1207504 RepID=UPI0018C8BAC8|nr:hypothetical protein [Burkholderia pseudomultivorans]MDS0795253.1 hypothetical protein [Burkholderia pseudomultivorans]
MPPSTGLLSADAHRSVGNDPAFAAANAQAFRSRGLRDWRRCSAPPAFHGNVVRIRLAGASVLCRAGAGSHRDNRDIVPRSKNHGSQGVSPELRSRHSPFR